MDIIRENQMLGDQPPSESQPRSREKKSASDANAKLTKKYIFPVRDPTQYNLPQDHFRTYFRLENMSDYAIANATLYFYVERPEKDRQKTGDYKYRVHIYKYTKKSELNDIDPFIESHQNLPGTGKWDSVNLTSLVAEWVATPWKNFGIMLRAEHVTSSSSEREELRIGRHNHQRNNTDMFLEIEVKSGEIAERQRVFKPTLSNDCSLEPPHYRNICCRFPLKVRARMPWEKLPMFTVCDNMFNSIDRGFRPFTDFESFGWDWIVVPKRYDAYYCAGSCEPPGSVEGPHGVVTKGMEAARRASGKPYVSGSIGPCCSPQDMQEMNVVFIDHKEEQNEIFQYVNSGNLPLYIPPYPANVYNDLIAHQIQKTWTEMLQHNDPGLKPILVTYSFFRPLPVSYPEFRVSSKGTITISLFHSILVELTLNKNIRICKVGGASFSLSVGGQFISIHHPQAEFFRSDNIAQLDSSQGHIFQVSLSTVHFKPPQPANKERNKNSCGFWTFGQRNVFWTEETETMSRGDPRMVQLPRDKDLSVDVFFYRSKTGRSLVDNCQESIRRSQTFFADRNRTNLNIQLHGIKIQQNCKTGNVILHSQLNTVHFNPAINFISVKTPLIHVSVKQDGAIQLRTDNYELRTSTSATTLIDTQTSHHYEAKFDHRGHLKTTVISA